jgi:dihydrolipoamide dehydrogenase
MSSLKSYDLFVVGAGPGGYTAALLGAKKGMRVGIAEGYDFGGTCTNRGCIPAKSYIESVNLFSRMKNAQRFGISAGQATLTLEGLHKRKTRIVSRLAKGIELLLSQAGVEIIRGYARFESAQSIRINDERISSSSIIIATGSRPKRPALFDIEGILTSDEVFGLTQLPSSLVIVGGGVIGMEMAHVFSNLGVEVTIIEALDRVLASEDKEISARVVSLYRKIRFITSARVKDVTRDSGFHVVMDKPDGTETIDASALLVCIGREPVIPEGLLSLGLELNPSRGIKVSPSMRTSLPGLYAIGDVTGSNMYAYVASKEASVAVDSICGGSMRLDYRAIPSVIFTHPEIASVGKSEDLNLMKKGSFPVSALGRARTMEESDGFATVYCTPEGRLERVTIMSEHATELISWATLAIDQGLHIKDFLNPHYPHPTMAELLKESAEDCLGLCINKP